MKQIQHDLLDPSSLMWHHYREDADYPYPVSYWGTILDIDDAGHISAVYRWDPGSFCHFHRHVCDVTSIVLQGELHVKTYEDGRPRRFLHAVHPVKRWTLRHIRVGGSGKSCPGPTGKLR